MPSLWEAIVIGHHVKRLQRVKRDSPLSPRYDESIYGSLELVWDFLHEAVLENTARRINGRIEEILSRLEDWEEPVLGDLASSIRTLAHDLWESIEDEASNRPIFFPIPAREIEVARLLANPTEWFLRRFGTVFEQPPPGVVEDFEEAARAFAAGFSASAIMFSLRALEGILREYYRGKTGSKPGSKTWGQMVQDLRKQIPDSLFQRLDSLRTLRNAAMHAGPRDPAEWDDENASRVLLTCREIIEAIIEDLLEDQPCSSSTSPTP